MIATCTLPHGSSLVPPALFVQLSVAVMTVDVRTVQETDLDRSARLTLALAAAQPARRCACVYAYSGGAAQPAGTPCWEGSDWWQLRDGSGRTYYSNLATSQVQWQPPPAPEPPPSPEAMLMQAAAQGDVSRVVAAVVDEGADLATAQVGPASTRDRG